MDPTSPLQGAGIAAGDVITPFDGRPVDICADVSGAMTATSPTVPTVTLQGVDADGKVWTRTVPMPALVAASKKLLEQMGVSTAPPAPAETQASSASGPGPTEMPSHSDDLGLGAILIPMRPGMSTLVGNPQTKSVYVVLVRTGSPAQAAGIEGGSVIVAYDGKPVDSLVSLAAAVGGVARRREAETRPLDRTDPANAFGPGLCASFTSVRSEQLTSTNLPPFFTSRTALARIAARTRAGRARSSGVRRQRGRVKQVLSSARFATACCSGYLPLSSKHSRVFDQGRSPCFAKRFEPWRY